MHPFFELILTLVSVVGQLLSLAAQNIEEQLEIRARSWQVKTAVTVLVNGNPERLMAAFNYVTGTGMAG